jgi:outer membrane protein assembly factor BamB
VGGSASRNNTPSGENIPTEWDIDAGTNIRWSKTLGSETYGNPVVANGKVFVGTNNGAAYIARYPSSVDLGALLCFDEKDGTFLWQHSNEKLPDWSCARLAASGDLLFAHGGWQSRVVRHQPR